ncbi:MAG: glycoside hydrolase family 130 protein [Clostridia bacterium]|nr:glycoside hydrolase family 130 protein [Clostridia bacterium]
MRKSSPVIKKLEKPVLTYKDIPYNAALIFNAGVAKVDGKYVMLFRNDYGDYENQILKGTNLGVARSDDGIHWVADPEPALAMKDDEVLRIYDPRLTVIDGKMHICFAQDTVHGLRGGIATTDDFKSMTIHSLSAPDNRNMVLFPEKINGMYVRLERPMPIYSRNRDKDTFDIWCSRSPDLRYWGDTELVLGVEHVPFANDKIGPAAPPVKTDRGWLTTFHAVEIDESRGKHGWEDKWTKMYYAGIMLLDLNDPSKVIGYSKEPLITPELPHETDVGFRTDVIFPGGMILEDNGEVKIYYGAADTVECLATADVNDLIDLCLNS